MFRKIFKRFFTRPLQICAKYYLSQKRNYHYNGITIEVFSGVFHPGLFLSTKSLLKFLSLQNIENQTFVEVGCGSGLISIASAKRGAKVLALDINTKSVENTKHNALINNVAIETLESNMFFSVSNKTFDWIVINPPYYPKEPQNAAEMAWFCGEGFEYFHLLFSQLQNVLNPHSQIIMILSEDCAVEKIQEIAKKNGFLMEKIWEERKMWEWQWVYKIKENIHHKKEAIHH